MKREAKANLARIVLYAFEKENGCRNNHLFDCLEAGSLTVRCMEGKQRAKKGKRGEGEEHYRIQGKQMEEIEIELQREDSKPFVSSELCFL